MKEREAQRNNSRVLSALLAPSLADLGCETSLDGRDTASASTRVAGDKVKSVLALAKLSVGRAASLASDVLNWLELAMLDFPGTLEAYRCIFEERFQSASAGIGP